MQFLTSDPNFRWSSDPWSGIPELLIVKTLKVPETENVLPPLPSKKRLSVPAIELHPRHRGAYPDILPFSGRPSSVSLQCSQLLKLTDVLLGGRHRGCCIAVWRHVTKLPTQHDYDDVSVPVEMTERTTGLKVQLEHSATDQQYTPIGGGHILPPIWYNILYAVYESAYIFMIKNVCMLS